MFLTPISLLLLSAQPALPLAIPAAPLRAEAAPVLVRSSLVWAPESNAAVSGPSAAPFSAQDDADAPDGAEEAPKWTGSVSAGIVSTKGNSEVTTSNINADATKEWGKNRMIFSAFGSRVEQEDQDTGETSTTARTYGASGQYDRFVSEKTYGFGKFELQSDELANLNKRTIYTAGAGRQFKKSKDLELKGELGLSFVDENFNGSSDDVDFLSMRAGYGVMWQMNENVKFSQESVVLRSLDDGDDMNARVDTRFRVKMTESMFSQLQYLFVWDNTPATGKERVDTTVAISVGWTF